MAKIARIFSKGAALTMRRIGSHQAEVISVPHPGIQEKPYQSRKPNWPPGGHTAVFYRESGKDRTPGVLAPRRQHNAGILISWDRTAISCLETRFVNIFPISLSRSRSVTGDLIFPSCPSGFSQPSIIAIGVYGRLDLVSFYQSNLQLL